MIGGFVGKSFGSPLPPTLLAIIINAVARAGKAVAQIVTGRKLDASATGADLNQAATARKLTHNLTGKER